MHADATAAPESVSGTDRMRLVGVHKSFPGVHALRGANMTVQPGEIHALLGENGSGKSTLMRIAAGHLRADSGQFWLDGQRHNWSRPRDPLRHGITTATQELDLAPNLTVAENICLGDLPRRRSAGLVDWDSVRTAARAALDRLDIALPLDKAVGALPPEERQLVEAARALLRADKVCILDEVTSFLSEGACAKLFQAVRAVADEGVSVIFISHRMREVFELASKATILRDGVTIGVVDLPDSSADDLLRMMVGREIGTFFTRTPVTPGRPQITARGLTSHGSFMDIDFDVRAGTVVGLAGLVGSGRAELCEALFGLRPLDSGTLHIEGLPVRLRRPKDAIAQGVAYVPANRKSQGVFANLSVTENITGVVWDQLTRYGFIQRGRERRLVREYVERLDVRCRSLETPVGVLSGGNQQKAVLARWLLADQQAYILSEPTRGIDIAAKMSVYRLIDDLRANGRAVLMSSSELPELLEVCDRLLVMFAGQIVAEFDPRQAGEEDVAYYMTGAFEHSAIRSGPLVRNESRDPPEPSGHVEGTQR